MGVLVSAQLADDMVHSTKQAKNAITNTTGGMQVAGGLTAAVTQSAY